MQLPILALCSGCGPKEQVSVSLLYICSVHSVHSVHTVRSHDRHVRSHDRHVLKIDLMYMYVHVSLVIILLRFWGSVLPMCYVALYIIAVWCSIQTLASGFCVGNKAMPSLAQLSDFLKAII